MSKELTHFEVLTTECDINLTRTKTAPTQRWLVRITDFVGTKELVPAARNRGKALGLTPMFYRRYVPHYNDGAQVTFRMHAPCELRSTYFRELVDAHDMGETYSGSELEVEGNFPCYVDVTTERAALCSIITFPDETHKDFVAATLAQVNDAIEYNKVGVTPVLTSRTELAWIVASGQLNLIANILKQPRYAQYDELLRKRSHQLMRQIDELHSVRGQLTGEPDGACE